LPDKITIFKGPIERVAKSEKEIKEIIKNTIWHEIGHHFGLSEKELEKKISKSK
jgi:predicted Zn-dependent protease with MMP-like domain